ncbi:MAG: VTT domain-containing protein [Mitsuaria chitosanitabida]|uniref:VTT domain-containing protein n=1 Tax=Roseateles chitosanitabidus TaxID=65048 RepID=UPI001B17DC93|nr:VTT domain-containing protein [Roseateles chitosanitabidus]MBO9685885.1 VTT domain-containing protein [Roseateles chitosanitabidus]
MRALIELLVLHDFLLVFLVTLAARVGAPVPAAPLLVVAGGLAAAGRISAGSLVTAAVLANVLGDAIWFIAGRNYGHRVLRLLCRVSLSPDVCVRQSESLIARWGGSSLLAAKFLPGISVVAAPMAGALGMGWRRFIAYDAIAGLVWSLCFLGLGLVFSNQIQDVLDALSNAGLIALAAIGALLLMLVGNRWRRRRQMARLAGEVERISVEDAAALVDQDMAPQFIDVRSDAGRAADPRTLPGALNIPLPRLPEYADQLPDDRLLVVYCNCPNEVSAITGAHQLLERGHARVLALEGGLDGWDALQRRRQRDRGDSGDLGGREGLDSRDARDGEPVESSTAHPAVP